MFFEDGRAEDVYRSLTDHGVQSISAKVTFSIMGKDIQYGNGLESSDVNDALEQLYSDVCERTEYSPRFDALPFYFAETQKKDLQIRSLKYHAEKKALATMLMNDSEDLSMRVNIKVCVDCHSFLSHASKMLGKEISVLEPAQAHLFDGGGCD